MDLNQRKLNKSEWEHIEVPISQQEQEVLEFILSAVGNVNLRFNKHTSLYQYLKINTSVVMLTPEKQARYIEDIDLYLFNTLFLEDVTRTFESASFEYEGIKRSGKKETTKKLKQADLLRIKSSLDRNKLNKENVFEILLLELVANIVSNTKFMLNYFTLYKMMSNSVKSINRHVVAIVEYVLEFYKPRIKMSEIVTNSVSYIEKNPLLLKYADIQLYKHQKEIFTVFRNEDFQRNQDAFLCGGTDADSQDARCSNEHGIYFVDNKVIDAQEEEGADNEVVARPSKLVLYISPTGTGKTITPIGLSTKYRIIFICAARHVGLALARASISVGKKVAFAFGCSSASDIRLHYFAAKDYTKDRKSGGIRKVDNSNGEKVEIMICDVRSYLYAMYYMKSFNPIDNLLVFFDEPTISLDYEEHNLHGYIKELWEKNEIPNMVLSSATLPKLDELRDTIASFQDKFPNAEVVEINSIDCKKSIPIINKYGYVVLPHNITTSYDELMTIIEHCLSNGTLLRYFDLQEVVDFILYVERNAFIGDIFWLDNIFTDLSEISMESIKLHYLSILKRVERDNWFAIYTNMTMTQKARIRENKAVTTTTNISMSSIHKNKSFDSSLIKEDKGGVPLKKIKSEMIDATEVKKVDVGAYVTTKDAYTLTDGPTIFLADDIEKIAKFCIQQSNIPVVALTEIMQKIEYNNKINEKITELEEELLAIEQNNITTEVTAKNKEALKNKELDDTVKGVSKINDLLEMYRKKIKSAELNETFVPNKTLHMKKWVGKVLENSFTSDIDEHTIMEIMMLTDVDNSWKLLLLKGIGSFHNHTSVRYTEIMKSLADKQKLFMIIASSDYIYGTNYQFCHGYISKDMRLTQEKIMQSMGRIGRGNIQQDYTVRVRDDAHVRLIFYPEIDKIEVRNMNALFS